MIPLYSSFSAVNKIQAMGEQDGRDRLESHPAPHKSCRNLFAKRTNGQANLIRKGQNYHAAPDGCDTKPPLGKGKSLRNPNQAKSAAVVLMAAIAPFLSRVYGRFASLSANSPEWTSWFRVE